MPRTDLAELILLLVTSHERAASMVGDFLEEAGTRGWRFWFLVVRTAVSQAWRQITETPFDLGGIAIRGLVAELGFLLLACIVQVMAIWTAVSILLVNFHADLPDWVVVWLGYFLGNLLVPFQVGRWMARRYPGREGAGSVTLATAHAMIRLCGGFILWGVSHVTGGEMHIDISFAQIHVIAWYDNIFHTLTATVFCLTLYPVLLLAGAAFARARSLHPPSNSQS